MRFGLDMNPHNRPSEIDGFLDIRKALRDRMGIRTDATQDDLKTLALIEHFLGNVYTQGYMDGQYDFRRRIRPRFLWWLLGPLSWDWSIKLPGGGIHETLLEAALAKVQPRVKKS